MISVLSAAAVLAALPVTSPLAAAAENRPPEAASEADQSACRAHGVMLTAQPGGRVLMYPSDDPVRLRRLSELPRPDHEKTVLRSVGGCALPLVVGYEVGR
ncbi:hypothetical protein [Phenylobacterium sp.]|uniref:hypothetical protein n=1 Tax=Phenylobacterium sp. TaxID=1871053 RepID=UPI00301BC262